ncbi:MAG TPA: YcfL family protein [Burkholderiales bacterium]|nr:YcfL family protein [Burkholderiales bacterium]
MTRQTMILTLLVCVLGAGCASKGKETPNYAFGCPMGHKTGTSMQDLIRAKVKMAGPVPDVRVTDIRCRMQSDLLHVDFTLMNRSGDVRRVSYRFEWMDEAGYRAWDAESWKPVMLYEHADETILATAPTRKATDFNIVLLDQDKSR